MVVVAIDCGLRGAIVALDAQGALLQFDLATSFYARGNRYRDELMCSTFLRYDELQPALIVIEEQHSRPNEGHRSIFTTGMGFGLWRGVTAYVADRRLIVAPTRWQAVTHKGAPGRTAKVRSLHVARVRVDPSIMHDGVADAVCMCLYARHVLGIDT